MSEVGSTAIGVLIVASDADTMRNWTHAVLSDHRLRLIAVVSRHSTAITLLDATAPDVLLVDLAVIEATAQHERIELLRQASRRQPRCDCLVVANCGSDDLIIAAIGAGAGGCISRQGLSPERVSAAIHELRAGGAPLDPLIARRILMGLRSNKPAQPPTRAPTSLLTQRETEILRLTAKGLVFKAISSLLQISSHTVVAHTRKIYQKLDVHSRGAAVHAADRNGWL